MANEDFDFIDVVDQEVKQVPVEVDDDIQEFGTNYIRIRDEVKKLTVRQNELKKKLMELAEEHGADESGSQSLELHEPINGMSHIVRQRSASNKKVDIEAAASILKDRGLYDKCTQQVTVIDEDKIMGYLYLSELSDEDIAAMYPTVEKFALVVRK